MTSRPIVFLDTETLGLGLDDPIWEIAVVRRETDGTETERHWFVCDYSLCTRDGLLDQVLDRSLPEPFASDVTGRYDHDRAIHWDRQELQDLAALLRDRPTIVGAVPNFDTERIAHQLGVTGWHHRLRCVETLTAGHLGRDVGGLTDCAEALGIPTDEAHTALGDVRMVRAIWDRIMSGAES